MKKWQYFPRKSEDVLEQLLINRKVKKTDFEKFLNPDYERDLHDPFLLNDMDIAVEALCKALDNNEKIGIFADYDADGIPGSAILYTALKKYFNAEVFVYIPTREQGYGLNKQGIDYFAENGVKLLVTVDLGIRENENIIYAKSKKMKVIVTDHHEVGKVLPPAMAVINPKRKDSKYPFYELSGGGVAFKLVQALGLKTAKISKNDLKWLLDLVAITTICDVVPLINENRVFAKYGLIVLKKSKRIGLKKIYDSARIDPENIDVYHVGFQIGPRLNAPGRMNQENEAFELLVTNNPVKAEMLAEKLNTINLERQKELETILNSARNLILQKRLDKNKLICISDKSFKSGLVGLVAGRLTEEFSRPCFILQEGEKISKGSARSIDGFDLVEALESLSSYLDKYGGHSKAAGLSIENQKLPQLYEKLIQLADQKLTNEDLILKLKIDLKLKLEQINFDLYEKIALLEPYGLGNSRPVFSLENVKPQKIQIIGKDQKHLKFFIGNCEAIYFDGAKEKDKIENNAIDLAFTIDLNLFNGTRRLQLKVVDININQ